VGKTYCVNLSDLDLSYEEVQPPTTEKDPVEVFKIAWKIYHIPNTKNNSTALQILTRLDAYNGIAVQSVGLNNQAVASVIESPVSEGKVYLSKLNVCNNANSTSTACCTLAAKASTFTSVITADTALVTKITAASTTLLSACGTTDVTTLISGWPKKWSDAVKIKDEDQKNTAVEKALTDLVTIEGGFKTLDTTIAEMDHQITAANGNKDMSQVEINKIKEQKAAVIESEGKVQGYYTTIKDQFATPCFNATISSDNVSGASSKKTKLDTSYGQTLDKVQTLTSVEAAKIINNNGLFEKVANPTLKTNQAACVLYWVLTAFKNNTTEIADDNKIKDVAAAIVKQFGFNKDKPTSISNIMGFIKNNDPNFPEVLLSSIEDNAETIDLKNVDFEVIKNEIYKMTTLPTVTYKSTADFQKVLDAQNSYIGTEADASELVRALSTLDKDAVIGDVVDELATKYGTTTSYDKATVVKAIKAVINKDANAEQDFIKLFKQDFVNICPDINSDDVTSSITPAVTIPAPITKTQPTITSTPVTPPNTDVPATLKTAIGTFLASATAADSTANLAALDALITKDVSMDKFKTAIKEELKADIKKADLDPVTKAQTFWTASNDAFLDKAIDAAFAATITSEDTLDKDIAAAINAACESDISKAVKDRLTAFASVVVLNATDPGIVYSKELIAIGTAVLLYEHGLTTQSALLGTKPTTKIDDTKKIVPTTKKGTLLLKGCKKHVKTTKKTKARSKKSSASAKKSTKKQASTASSKKAKTKVLIHKAAA